MSGGGLEAYRKALNEFLTECLYVIECRVQDLQWIERNYREGVRAGRGGDVQQPTAQSTAVQFNSLEVGGDRGASPSGQPDTSGAGGKGGGAASDAAAGGTGAT